MKEVPKVLHLSHDNRFSLKNCIYYIFIVKQKDFGGLGNVHRCQNFWYAVITECSYASEIFILVSFYRITYYEMIGGVRNRWNIYI